MSHCPSHRITASGSTILPLNCISEGSQPGKNDATACNTADSVPVLGKVTKREDLPAYSIIDPLPVPDGCTASSMASPSWKITSFEVDSNSGASFPLSPGAISFNLQLKSSDRTNQFATSVTANVTNNPNIWFPCVFRAR